MSPPKYYYHQPQEGEFELPRSIRTYLDTFCDEYNRYPIEQKLCDLGYQQIMGYNLIDDIRALRKRRPDISEDSIRRAIIQLESKLVGSNVGWHDNSLDVELQLFLYELRRRYVYYANGEAHYIEYNDFYGKFDCDANGWKYIDWKADRVYDPDKEFYLRDDREYIRHYNETHRKPVIINPHVLPEPWYGNPLKAKIIIIAPAQLFHPGMHIEANALLHGRTDAAQGLQRFLKIQYNLWAKHMFHADESERSGVYYDDYYNSPGFRHWVDELSALAKAEGIDPDVLSANVAVVNEFPYLLVEPGALPEGFLLPSQHVLRQMMMVRIRSSYYTRPLFILPRATRKRHPYWARVMDCIWDGTWGSLANKVTGRMSNRSMTLSPKGLGSDAYAQVIEAIKGL